MSRTDDEVIKRLDALEERLQRVEMLLNEVGAGEEDLDFTFEELAPQPDSRRFVSQRPRRPENPFSVTQLLGWGGVAALVLAAVYLIKLGIDHGWLTPARQIMTAVVGAGGLVGTGIFLRRADRHYASLLPAGGVVILFMATYGAHLYYRLIPFGGALLAIVLICLLSLWLCHFFESELYALFAVIGSYSAPMLLDGLRTGVGELALYYTAWSLLFSLYSVWFGRRGIYLLASYMALLGFDIVWVLQWHAINNAPWQAAVLFQVLQLVIFGIATVLYSIHRDSPLKESGAWAHLPPLLLFYALEYALLAKYLPVWAPWIAIGSTLFVGLLYWVVRTTTRRDLPGGQLLLAVYVTVVLFHAGYLEALPIDWHPWAGLLAGVLLVAWAGLEKVGIAGRVPVLVFFGVIFLINLLRVLANFELDDVLGGRWLSLVYAIELYFGYAMVRRSGALSQFEGILVYCGHLTAMAAALHLFDHRLAISLAWSLLAVISLGLAIYHNDRLLGQSSLLVFAASALKVLLFDLAGAAPLVRILCLLVLGCSCYLGGWLYRKMGTEKESPA